MPSKGSDDDEAPGPPPEHQEGLAGLRPRPLHVLLRLSRLQGDDDDDDDDDDDHDDHAPSVSPSRSGYIKTSSKRHGRVYLKIS